ncbi:PP2C family protein-serine/threonine phosphatase [Streptomyces sp. NPDC057101]|uniref:PP2C family protein-serine/threonine phosphatase n=1 Tax=Streptomyces sp. NPDC057101 TaxID=3346020 RepID=UPI0036380203
MLPVLLVVGVGGATLASPEPLDIDFMLGAISPLAVLSYGPLATAALGAASVALLIVPGLHRDQQGNTDLLTLGFVATLSVFVSFVRSRRDAQLDLERTVAEAAQRALVPAVGGRVGAVRCASLYRAAQRDTLVGGDFFDVRAGPHGIRAVLGDVQGHGLSAVATVASVMGAFREAVLDEPDLEAIAARLDRRLRVDSKDTEHAELFATAVLVEFSPDVRSVRVVSCGHPPPALLRGSAVGAIELEAGPPLGLGLAEFAPATAVELELSPGDRLFLTSDGVLEARNPAGAFYPLEQRLTRLSGTALGALPDTVWADLKRFAPRVQDDVTMLVLEPAADRRTGHDGVEPERRARGPAHRSRRAPDHGGRERPHGRCRVRRPRARPARLRYA